MKICHSYTLYPCRITTPIVLFRDTQAFISFLKRYFDYTNFISFLTTMLVRH